MHIETTEGMRILLVQPSRRGGNGILLKRKKPFIRSLVLPYIAGLTPQGIDVEIVDDSVEEIDFRAPYDLIGLTALTSQAPRAYEIADAFRRRRRKVVMGGFHATAMPNEAIQHCDGVVIGEAESVWEGLLDDVRSGHLRRFYRSEEFHDLRNLPRPRFDLLHRKDFDLPFFPVQASRGCPHDCHFCSVSRFYGRRYRFRPVEDVVEDVRACESRRIVFVDDNITANRKYSRELFKALIPLKINWIGQCTIHLGRDPELCRLAADSGCYFMGIGIESLDQDNLCAMDKGWNRVPDFPVLLHTIRTHGIGLVLNMIVGLDNDTEACFDRVLQFLLRSKAFYVVLNTLIPYPGTELARRLEEEGRLLGKDWSEYVQGNVLYAPKHMTAERLKQGYWWILDRFFSYRSILRRAFSQPLRNLPFYFQRNLALHMSVMRRVY